MKDYECSIPKQEQSTDDSQEGLRGLLRLIARQIVHKLAVAQMPTQVPDNGRGETASARQTTKRPQG
jgi:hypothetical protein